MSKSLQKAEHGSSNLSVERRMMNEALARLGQIGIASSQNLKPEAANLVFMLDLTGSRAASLEHARVATSTMFDAIKSIGSVAVKLMYYRGHSECKASDWVNDPDILNRALLRLSCKTGETQIARVLRRILRSENRRVSAVVFIGDHCEDSPAELTALAIALGQKGIPVFVFHECADGDWRSVDAQPVFECIASVSGGVYCEFKPDSGAVFRDLLSNVAAFSTAGPDGIRKITAATTITGRRLQERLLLSGSSEATARNERS